MTSRRDDLGISEGRLAEIKLRLLDLNHSSWRAQGDEVVRSSNRADGEPVASCCDKAVARFVASAPADVEILVREVELLRMEAKKLQDDASEADRAALSARAECGRWKEFAQRMRRSWREFFAAISAKEGP